MSRATRGSLFDRPRRAHRARSKLFRHGDVGTPAIESVEFDIARLPDGRVEISYMLFGDPSAIAIPPRVPPERADRLWEHSCCELFVKAADRDAYFEFNFSSSTQWAAYRFSDYRSGMELARGVSAPEIALRVAPGSTILTAKVDLSRVPGLPEGADWPVGISAIIEGRDGGKSYWALKHPSRDKPDFHHPDCFAMVLAAPLRA